MLVALTLAVLALWVAARARSALESRVPRVTGKRTPYHSVTVAAGPGACERARLLARRDCALLPGDVPRLPLPDCERERCDCRYVHHPDRRRRVRRAADRGWPSRGLGGLDRRRRPDRRRDDDDETSGG